MATTQLPTGQLQVGGQPALTGWNIISGTYGIEEDAETKYDAAGRFKCKIVYGRRATLQVTMEAQSGTTTTTYDTGGGILSGVFADGAGNATAWKIRNSTRTNTRGPVQVTLDLIAQTDLLA